MRLVRSPRSWVSTFAPSIGGSSTPKGHSARSSGPPGPRTGMDSGLTFEQWLGSRMATIADATPLAAPLPAHARYKSASLGRGFVGRRGIAALAATGLAWLGAGVAFHSFNPVDWFHHR